MRLRPRAPALAALLLPVIVPGVGAASTPSPPPAPPGPYQHLTFGTWTAGVVESGSWVDYYVVAGSDEGEGVGSSDAEAHTRFEGDAGFSDFSDGSLLVRGGSEWTREADCDGEEGIGRTEAIGRMAREELEAGLGRGRYAVGAEWDEGSMVHAMRRFGGRTVEWRFGESR